MDHPNVKSVLLLGLVGMTAYYCCRYLPLARSEPPVPCDFSLKIPSSGGKHFCFPGYGCSYTYAHDDCDAQCRDRAFQTGACSNAYYNVSPAGRAEYDYHCCCYEMTSSENH